jgi:hypothetical protein
MSWIRNTVIGLSGFALVSAAVSGCGSVSRDDTGEIIDPGEIDVFSFQVGDCLEDLDFGSEDEDGESQVTEGIGVPCSEPHVYEVYSQLFFEELELEEIMEIYFDECLKDFESYVGVPYEDSSFYIQGLYPTELGYNKFGDREVTCMLMTEEGTPVTGSAKGSGK